jgi:CHAT domain-containing protein
MTGTRLAMIAAAVFFGSLPGAARGAEVPSPAFRATLHGYFDDGDYLEALRSFQSQSRGSIKTPQSRWIDSICYETMCGECHYQMGNLKAALECYTNALQLYVRFADWMTLVRFDPTISVAPASERKAVPWGASTMPSKLGRCPNAVPLFVPQTGVYQTSKGALLMQSANGWPVTPHEIVRCTTLALRRRAMLLGPVAKHDDFAGRVASALAGPVAMPNHWSGAWVDVERGLSLLGTERAGQSQAAGLLQRGMLAAGEFEHPMTCIALFELGRLAMGRGDYPAAAKFFDEATYSAVNFHDYEVLEEAFRYGALVHLAMNRKGLFPPLLPAMQWAKQNRLRQLYASLLLSAAENYAVLGDTRQAAAMLDEARTTVGRRSMGAGAVGARLSYLSALVAYQQRRMPEGNVALAAAMNYMRHGALWLFHIQLADGLCAGKGGLGRSALDLYGEVLREPLPIDWVLDPMESMAVLITPQPAPMEHWFEAALARADTSTKEVKTAIEIADCIRRRRFFNSLDLGGRLESLRWILESPAARLPPEAQLQRQDLMARYPAYSHLAQQSQATREALTKQPLVIDDPAALKEQSRQLGQWAAVSAEQEAVLRAIALRREPADMVFPPQRTVTDVQKALPPKHAVLVFFATSRHVHAFMLNNERCAYWRIASPAAMMRQVQTMLRDIGQYGANHELTLKDLDNGKWKQSTRQLLKSVEGSQLDFSQKFDELIVVPDSFVWYLPFEALQVGTDETHPLITRVPIRYAPTLSLCTPQNPTRGAAGDTAVVVGKLFPRDTGATRAAFDQLAAAVPNTVALRSPLPGPAPVYGALLPRLIVLDDLAVAEQSPYGWSPVPTDRTKPGGTLADWFPLPWGGPELVVLPGFHTAAEDAMKRRSRDLPPGNDVFLSVCGLMANGAQTVLLSRWRTGGQTSFDLVREFAQELPHSAPAAAWQRAVLLAMDSRLNFEAEPRVKHRADDETPKANHPFFWAGYLLVDSGVVPAKEPPEPHAPPVKVKKPAEAAKPKA